MLSAMKTAVAAAGLFGVLASAQLSADATVCPFNATLGPNILVAVLKLPSNETEIGAWIYGRNWCNHYNKISEGMDICTSTRDRTVEFTKIPMTDKFGGGNENCYADVDISFNGCEWNGDDHKSINYRKVTAHVTAKDRDGNIGSEVFDYQCTEDREYRACAFNPQLAIPTETTYTAFMSCGVMAGPV